MSTPSKDSKYFLPILVLLGWIGWLTAQDSHPSIKDDTASLILKVLEQRPQGGYSARARVVHQSMGKKDLILQIAMQGFQSAEAGKTLYQVLWPPELKGRAVVVIVSNKKQSTDGFVFEPPDHVDPIHTAEMKRFLFETLLQVEDLADPYWRWPDQKRVGEEIIGGEICAILESKPGHSDESGRGKVITWISLEKNIPLKIHKFDPDGILEKTVRFERLIKRTDGTWVAADTIIENPYSGDSTRIEGTRSRQNAEVPDRVFTVEHLKALVR